MRTPRDRSARGGVVNVGVGPEAGADLPRAAGPRHLHGLPRRRPAHQPALLQRRGRHRPVLRGAARARLVRRGRPDDRPGSAARGCSTGRDGSTAARWVARRPVSSVARTTSSCVAGLGGPAAGPVRATRTRPTGSDSWASLQEAPPSTLTSTRATLPHPDHARPSSVIGPASSVLERVKNSGNPGGIINARGIMRVTGVPSSSSSLPETVGPHLVTRRTARRRR